MKTCCPHCQTIYHIDEDALRASHGMARCFNCDQVFNALEHLQQPEPEQPIQLSREDADPESLLLEDDDSFLGGASWGEEKADPSSVQLPFDVPEDLPAIAPSEDATLDAKGSLIPRIKEPAPLWQKLLLGLLIPLLLAQLIWFNRVNLSDLPGMGLLCQQVECALPISRDTEAFKVLERQLEADPHFPDALRLHLRVQNAAAFAQQPPDLQLTLFDSNESLLARRRLMPADYLFPAPDENFMLAAQEVITIEIVFEDPGLRASGFKLDFL